MAETHPHEHDRWGEATAFLERVGARWLDLVLLVGLIGVVFGLISLAGEWRTLHPQPIVLKPSAPSLPPVMLLTLLLSFGVFTLLYVGFVMQRYAIGEGADDA